MDANYAECCAKLGPFEIMDRQRTFDLVAIPHRFQRAGIKIEWKHESDGWGLPVLYLVFVPPKASTAPPIDS
jgi:hypothetical protein